MKRILCLFLVLSALAAGFVLGSWSVLTQSRITADDSTIYIDIFGQLYTHEQ